MFLKNRAKYFFLPLLHNHVNQELDVQSLAVSLGPLHTHRSARGAYLLDRSE